MAADEKTQWRWAISVVSRWVTSYFDDRKKPSAPARTLGLAILKRLEQLGDVPGPVKVEAGYNENFYVTWDTFGDGTDRAWLEMEFTAQGEMRWEAKAPGTRVEHGSTLATALLRLKQMAAKG